MNVIRRNLPLWKVQIIGFVIVWLGPAAIALGSWYAYSTRDPKWLALILPGLAFSLLVLVFNHIARASAAASPPC